MAVTPLPQFTAPPTESLRKYPTRHNPSFNPTLVDQRATLRYYKPLKTKTERQSYKEVCMPFTRQKLVFENIKTICLLSTVLQQMCHPHITRKLSDYLPNAFFNLGKHLFTTNQGKEAVSCSCWCHITAAKWAFTSLQKKGTISTGMHR